MTTKKHWFFSLPYYLWLALFVVAPLVLIFYQSFQGLNGHFTVQNYVNFAESGVYLKMTFNSVWYAFLITVITLIISYPVAYIIAQFKSRDFWLALIIMPTWINLLLKTYAFIGILGENGSINNFLRFIGIGSHQLLFTDASFMLVAAYIELPFMILPIYNSIVAIRPSLINASLDLGASRWQTFRRVILPLTKNGVFAGIQAVFIPSLSLFMITRLIGGNRVITLGTAIEEHFLTTQNWGMGSTIGVVLVVAMLIVMLLTDDSGKGVHR
ncbi:ABC transporter permease [Lactobacillus alvi]|uniref:ABC transporter permease n=1 Tax=Limosilactobacillus alvi TaxID=990412 RepID=A0ABS2EQH4_9LACO|nr:ABC transporter permease [Limosilactobacillus alvi]MBM6754640.1 ABC transporter permease [Limosilactobacillus alvi]